MTIETYLKPDTASALEAQSQALKIAFAPIVFQVTHALLKLNILKLIGDKGEEGISAAAIAATLSLSVYAVDVLLSVGLSAKLVWLKDDAYVLDKTGHFVLCDSMVQTNINFMQDVCYSGFTHLLDAITRGKPEGLKVFGPWDTIYPALSLLPPKAKTSWFQFDHYYSDKAFPEVLPEVFSRPVKHLLDIGGNTGKWALQCVTYDPKVQVTIVDLPEQLAVAQASMQAQQLEHRVHGYPLNLLANDAVLPSGADVIWMSQFLDCFSEAAILSILQKAAAVMDAHTRLYILELFWDRQTFEAAAFTINCTSLYFTCMANGNSRMYHAKDMLRLIAEAGLAVIVDKDAIGLGHTLLGCVKKPMSKT